MYEPTLRIEAYDETKNNDNLLNNLDLLEEKRDRALLRSEAYKQKMSQYYNSKVKIRTLKEGQLVMRKVQNPTGKFTPKWEGPYFVSEVLGKGAYSLKDLDGNSIPRAWSIVNLKAYYQ